MRTVYDILGRHPIHPFPARMAPSIALDAIGESKRPLRVLDPMVGSGTALAVARKAGHRTYGFDIDPLAVLLARVWTSSVDPQTVLAKSIQVLKRARQIFPDLPQRAAYPHAADEETRSFVRFWFDEYARRQLASLAKSIGRIHDPSLREVLWCGFSRLIITKQSGASRAMDLSHSRPHRVFDRAPVKPFARFLDAVAHVVKNCPHKGTGRIGPFATVREGDARYLPLSADSIDLVITSPPYLNAIDYLRCSKFSLVWMGYPIDVLRDLRATSVGSEVSAIGSSTGSSVREALQGMGDLESLSERDQRKLARFVQDMSLVMQEVSRVLRSNGRAVLVIGDSTIRGTFISNSNALAVLAEGSGLRIASRKTRTLPPNRRYLPPPSARNVGSRMQARMRSEVILELRATHG